MSKLKGKRILVSGGSGFIPSHLTRRLVGEGARVGILTKYNSIIDNIRLVDVWDKITVIEADIRNLDSLKQVSLFKPEIIYHFAAYNHVGDSFIHVAETLDCNVRGTANLLESYDKYKKFIYISSSEVYGYQTKVPFSEDMFPKPISPYAVGKYGGELYCRMKMENMHKPIVILRPFNAFGPYQSPRAIIAEIIIACLKGKPVFTTEGRQTRDFNYVENLSDGFVKAVEVDEAVGKIINIGSGEDISIRDLVLRIHKETNSSSKLHIGALKYRPTEVWRMRSDNRRAQTILKWKPKIDFKEGLRRTIAWYRNFLTQYNATDSPLSRLSRFCD